MADDTDAELASLPREELVERARALQTVLRVAQAVTNARSVDDLAERFAEAVAAYTRFPSVVVLRFVPARDGFEILTQRGFDESRFPPRKILPARGSLTGLAVARGQILTTEDIAGDDRLDPETRVALAANAYTTGVCVPVLHGGEVLGSFNLVYPRGTALRLGERRMLGALATSLGLSMAQQVAAERERALEAQAGRAQQLESLGVLAGGIAHDFNNLLTGIVGNVDLARVVADENRQTRIVGLLSEALDAAARATSLVRQLLTFARGGAPSRQATRELGALIREVSSFAASGTSVRCDIDVAEPLGVVDVDVGQIGQVLQNLVLNACQASPRGATVTVRARRVDLAGGARVVIEVVDTGDGIAPEHLPHIFEPFFTRRPGGTGLGLAVSHSIVQRHGGRLTVKSEVGHGTTFTVELLGSEGGPLEAPRPIASAKRFSGRALVLDDEDAVRLVAELLLKELGFEVETARHGAEALEIARRATAEGHPFRVALLDLTIVGGLGGAEIADDLRLASPGIRLIVSSGYAREGTGDGWDARLHKPYLINDLTTALERALTAAPVVDADPAPR
jgi:signal transduction histidine kinase/CheY-like chemotaxis protein